MLNSDLIALERAVYRAAREQLSSDNQTEQPDGELRPCQVRVSEPL